MGNRILIVGTYDTKDDELTYLAEVIRKQGGAALTMDVSVLGEPKAPTDWSKHDVVTEAGTTIEAIIAAEDENVAMQAMARGAALLASRLYRAGRFDGVLVLGGSMGTDLALDLCAALPLGVPKYVVSTVSFSPMIPSARLPADIQMILWAGGPLWAEFGLQGFAVTGGGGGFGGGAGGRDAAGEEAADWDDRVWQDGAALYGGAETGARDAWV